MGNALYLYIGTWGSREQEGDGKGVYGCRMDTSTGELSPAGLLSDVDEPGVVAVSPDRRTLYTVNEMTRFPDGQAGSGGGVSALRIDPETGALSLLGQVSSLGTLPAFLCTDPAGEYVLCADHSTFQVVSRYVRGEDGKYHCERSYDASGVALFKVQPDGGLSQGCDFAEIREPGSAWAYEKDPSKFVHEFSGLPIDSPTFLQDHPHAHSVNADPYGLVYVCDRGSDSVILMEIDRQNDRLRTVFSYHTRLGTGPRHLALHPEKPYFYITSEIESSVTVFAVDREAKTFRELQTVPTLPEGCKEKNGPSDIHVHPSGRFVYAGNRGYDSIAVYAVHEETGLLSPVEVFELGKPEPRGFAIDPSGQFLVVGHRKAGEVESYRISQETGKLSRTGFTTSVPSPCCIRFCPI